MKVDGVADFLGADISDFAAETFARVAKLDAKNPGLGFESDSQAKQKRASEVVRVTAEKWLAPLYEQLETARLRCSAA